MQGDFDMTSTEETKGPIPPYLPFKTFQSAVENLRSHGLPTTIDKTTWNRSGTDTQLILTAFKFLALVDGSERPQEVLKKIVAAKANSQEERDLVGQLLQQRYAKVFEHDLTTATPKQVDDAIESYGAKGTTRDRCVRFFIKAAEFAGIPMSPRLTKTAKVENPADGQEDTASAKPTNGRHKKKKRSSSTSDTTEKTPIRQESGNAMKTIQLPGVGGSLTISGT